MKKAKKAKQRQKLSWENLTYSFKRMDTLIISISGAGIYTCLSTIKFLLQEQISNDFQWIINSSGTLFALSIIINFVSQYTGAKSNEYDFLMSEEEIDANGKPDQVAKRKIDKYNQNSDKFSNATDILNIFSIVLLGIGLLSLTVFYWIIF